MSNENNSSKKMKLRQKERGEEVKLLDRFKNVATQKLSKMARQAEEEGIKYQMGEEEKRVFQQMHGMGIKEGIAAGIITFAVLRRGPIYISRWVYQRRLRLRQQQQQQQQQRPPSTSQQSQNMTPPPGDGSYRLSDPNQVGNPFQVAQRPDFPRSKNFVVRGIWFAFDSVLSLMMAASVSMAYTDTDKIREQLLGLPLVPGRSLTSDALCREISKELVQVQAENSPAYQRLSSKERLEKDPAALYLQGIQDFVANCQRRHYVEAQLYKEHEQEIQEAVRWASDESNVDSTTNNNKDLMAIPHPIPKDGPRLVRHADGTEEVIYNSSNEENPSMNASGDSFY